MWHASQPESGSTGTGKSFLGDAADAKAIVDDLSYVLDDASTVASYVEGMKPAYSRKELRHRRHARRSPLALHRRPTGGQTGGEKGRRCMALDRSTTVLPCGVRGSPSTHCQRFSRLRSE